MDGYVPAVIDASDLVSPRCSHSRTAVADDDGPGRIAAPPDDGRRRSRALGDLLASGDSEHCSTPTAELIWLSGQLQTVAHDDLLLAALEERLPRSSTRGPGCATSSP
jgi:hypothetical protein